MTTAAYLGAALCYDAAHVGVYESACVDANPEGNWYGINGRQFNCKGILMYNFYVGLYDAGETAQCVCKFANTADGWAFDGHWGPCNGACVAAKYACDGNTPYVVVSDSDAADAVVKRATPTNATSGSTPSSSSTSFAAPRTVGNWKTALCVVATTLVSVLVSHIA
ncbi:hypothetical protein AYL99_02644 [Fonsecaea erecta]|uniref:Uncharacterized protein n=1 Tax=Fonsecaea erecta TaxID=1367422 RepID=A0A178ZUJ1_9EURO|nr:hypothetical protein AYL99_02644 [Fonsecaea erecta]OAP63417.1 hypothetical protein AYL99_02644 [Fonsecaea erecta]